MLDFIALAFCSSPESFARCALDLVNNAARQHLADRGLPRLGAFALDHLRRDNHPGPLFLDREFGTSDPSKNLTAKAQINTRRETAAFHERAGKDLPPPERGSAHAAPRFAGGKVFQGNITPKRLDLIFQIERRCPDRFHGLADRARLQPGLLGQRPACLRAALTASPVQCS